MVRRAASLALGKLAMVVEAEHVASELVPLFHALAQDEQDSVRLLTVDTCVALAKVLPEADRTDKVVAVVQSIVADRSWRVRWSVAGNMVDLCAVLGPETTQSHLIDAFADLLHRFLCRWRKGFHVAC